MFRFTGVEDTVCSGLAKIATGSELRGRESAGGGCAVRVIEHQRERYEVHEVPYGKVYSWRPERIVFECNCGETLVWTNPVAACGCGTVHTGIPFEGRGTSEEPDHPWLEEYEEWRRKREADSLRREYFGFVRPGDD